MRAPTSFSAAFCSPDASGATEHPHPRDFTVTLRAHVDPESAPFEVELVVSGRSAGHVAAVTRWRDCAFPVTVHQRRPGFDEIELRFSAKNDDPTKRLELADHSLKLNATAGEETP